MDYRFFRDILSFDSTSGTEAAFSAFLAERISELLGKLCPDNLPSLLRQDVGDGTENLLYSWGSPRIVYCTHMDTVPPFLPPVEKEDRFEGRGSCDAKGQLFAMLTACASLASEGKTDFGLLLLSGEETGSYGAKAFARTDFRAPYLVVGEPTDNRSVSASKGTKAFSLSFRGEAFHSGYPQYGISAVDLFVDFVEKLRAADLPDDPLLGPTTWNIGRLSSDNPQNILSPSLSCRLYFRTTFATDGMIGDLVSSLASDRLAVEALGGDEPRRYLTVDGIPVAPASFGSDAPHLTNFSNRMILGAGSILTAHRPDEFVLKSDLEKAVQQYRYIYEQL